MLNYNDRGRDMLQCFNITWAGTQHFLQDPPDNNSDQPAQAHSLVIVFASRSMRSQTSKLSLDGRQRFCSESMNAWTDPSLRSAHMQYCKKCCFTAQL